MVCFDDFIGHLRAQDRSEHIISSYRRDPEDFAAWFETINGEEFTSERVTPSGRDGGCDRVHVPFFRSQSGGRGVSLDWVAMLLGHNSLDTTARYTRPGERDLEEAVSRVEWG